MSAARIVYMELAARRRSLAPVRYASLAAGKGLRNKSEMKDQLFKPVSNARGVVFSRIEKPVPAASEFIGKQFQTKNRNQINNRANMLNLQWHNHSLNLTEPAVDDFARAKTTSYNRTWIYHARTGFRADAISAAG